MIRGFYFFLLTATLQLNSQGSFKSVFKEDEFNGEVHLQFQDSKGFLWVATTLGLYRYDSKKWEYYSTFDGLPNNEVLRFCEDSKGRIWISTFSDELCYYFNGKIHNKKTDPKLKNIKIPYGSHMLEVNNELWVNGENSNLYEFDFSYLKYKFDSNFSINTTNGRFHYFININNKISVLKFVRKGENYFSFYDFKNKKNILNVDKNINLDYLTYGLFYKQIKDGFYIYNFKLKKYFKYNLLLEKVDSFEFKFLIHNFIYKTNFGELYFQDSTLKCFYNNKTTELFKLNYNSKYYTNEVYNNNLFLQFRKNIYYSPIDNALNIRTIKSGDINKVNIINQDVYTLENKNIIHLLNTKLKWQIKVNDNSQMVYNSYQDAENIYYSFHIDIKKFNIKSKEVSLPLNNYFYENEDSNIKKGLLKIREIPIKWSLLYSNKLFFSNLSGIHTYQNNLFQRINTVKTNTFFIDSKNRIWYSTSSGNYYATKYEPKILNPKRLILSNKITVLINYYAEDVLGNIILATNNGIYIVTTKDSIYSLNSSNILTSNECNKVILDKDGTLWISTDKGLQHISYLKNKKIVYKKINTFNKTDGLLSDNISDFAIKGDSVYVASSKGLNLILNKNTIPQRISIPIYINNYFVNGVKWDKDSLTTLNYDQNSIEIDFSTIYYERNERMKTYYRLISQNDTFVQELKENNILLQSLSPNDYSLQIYSYDQDYSFIKSNIKELKFTIRPPFYKTWWFFGFIFLLLLGIGFLIFYQYFKNQKNKIFFEKELSKLQLEALKAEMNPHFIFNCLNGIKDFMMQRDFEKSQHYLSILSKLIRQALYNSKEHFVSIEDEIRFIDLYIEMEQMRFSSKFEYIKNLVEFESYHIQIPTMLLQPFLKMLLDMVK